MLVATPPTKSTIADLEAPANIPFLFSLSYTFFRESLSTALVINALDAACLAAVPAPPVNKDKTPVGDATVAAT